MPRGEIRLADLDPAMAAARLGRGVVTVVPVTSNITRVYPFQVLLPAAETGITVDSKPRPSKFAPSPWNDSAESSAASRPI